MVVHVNFVEYSQMILQSGSTPTVLQQLSNLPFAYFSNPKLVRILFPTLLACCVDNPQNKIILDQEMSFQVIFRDSSVLYEDKNFNEARFDFFLSKCYSY